MKMTITKKTGLLIFATLLLLSFLLINFSSSIIFGGRYFDFTSDKRLSLNQKTKDMLKEMTTPITIRLYVSSGIEKAYPRRWQYSKAIIKLLEQYRLHSNGKINYEVKYPEPYNNTAKEGQKIGIKEFYSPDGKNALYFGALVMTDRGEGYVIPEFVELRNNYLESDINRLVIKLNENQARPKVGVMAPELISGRILGNTEETLPKLNFLRQLTNDYELVLISPNTVQIGVDINTMIVVTPSDSLTIEALYAIDQFVLRGGNLIIFIDSYNETHNRMSKEEGIKPLLENWGFVSDMTQVVGDKKNAEEALFEGQAIIFYPWLNIPWGNINQQHQLTQGLNNLIYRSPVGIEIVSKEGIRYTPLVSTSEQGGKISAKTVSLPDKTAVLRQYKDEKKYYNLAVLAEGKFTSLFRKSLFANSKYKDNLLEFLPESLSTGKVLVIGDTDFIENEIWSDSEYTDKNPIYGIISWADNGDFVLRAVDYMNNKTKYLQNQHKPLFFDASLQSLFQDKVMEEYQEKYNASIRDLKKNSLIVKQLQQEERTSGLTLQKMKELNEVQSKISQTEQTLREYNYEIAKKVDHQKLKFIIYVSVLSIGLIIILLILGNISRRSRRYINPLEEKDG